MAAGEDDGIRRRVEASEIGVARPFQGRLTLTRLTPDTNWPAAIPTVANRISGTIAEKEHLMGRLGFPELMIILVIVIIIFGANRLPQLGRGIGSAIKNFKDGMKDETTDLKS
jgi:TatA/E family protein of Tat protein translocase